MPSWDALAAEAPELAATVRACFERARHSTMATLRRDGSPRISGTEVEFADGELWLGSMPDAVKARDLQRDGRLALHSPTSDPPPEDNAAWPGEAKLAGTAVEVTGPSKPADSHRFRLDITEAVFTRVEGDELVIVSWHAGRGVETRRRA